MVEGGFGNCGVFLAHNYVSEQFGNYVEYGTCNMIKRLLKTSPSNQTLEFNALLCEIEEHSRVFKQ